MRLEQQIAIAAPIEQAWAFLTDLPAVSRCVPDIQSIDAVDADTVSGTIAVRLGPIALHLAGRVRMVERDAERHAAALEIEATDRRIGGGVKARTTFQVASADGDPGSVLTVTTDATLLGRLGQFGQPIIRRKSDELAQQFARNVAATLAAGGKPAA